MDNFSKDFQKFVKCMEEHGLIDSRNPLPLGMWMNVMQKIIKLISFA
jgi:hypothetical protein